MDSTDYLRFIFYSFKKIWNQSYWGQLHYSKSYGTMWIFGRRIRPLQKQRNIKIRKSNYLRKNFRILIPKSTICEFLAKKWPWQRKCNVINIFATTDTSTVTYFSSEEEKTEDKTVTDIEGIWMNSEQRTEKWMNPDRERFLEIIAEAQKKG